MKESVFVDGYNSRVRWTPLLSANGGQTIKLFAHSTWLWTMVDAMYMAYINEMPPYFNIEA